MTYTEIMIDLETLGNRNNAAVVSIGAVRFNIEDSDTWESMYTDGTRYFYVPIRLDDLNGDVDGTTLEWWFQQSDEARKVFKTTKDHATMENALKGFSMFWSGLHGSDTPNVWGNGSVFDNVILSSAYERHNLVKPWAYNQDRDVRTIIDLAKRIDFTFDPKKFRETGVAHDALNDAINQVLMVQEAWRIIK
jgi:hypothetical protein